ncbi:hypothetical protein MCJ35_31370 [Enterocloster sp. OA13]|uniref:hypothetical protein n=1 Tax=Enterocloster sp. OA13 TaxID=2914161 RepID=UPI001F065E50|nr:hypothetical protein [Enterocloster sp. OA13]
MQLTPNYNLKKPEGTDPVDIQDFNDNADVVDAALKKKAESSGGDISEMTVKTLDNITTDFPVPVAGEKPKTCLGKVKKFFEDTKNWMTGVCLIGSIVNNCVTDNAKLPLSAAQGKALMDLYTVLNTNLANTALVANTANTKIELNGPIKVIAYGSDRNKWAFQQQFSDGVILSLGISETEIFYDYYDGKSWTRKWTR